MSEMQMMNGFSQELADNVAKRTLGVEWASSEVEGLEFYRQNAPTSNSVCMSSQVLRSCCKEERA